MVIDAAKGIEARTRKLFEVCRLRDIPIITFINKMDRESRDPFDLLDEIEKTLALDTAPMTWPIGRGRDFVGTLDVATGAVRLMDGTNRGTPRQMDVAALAALNPNLDAAALAEEFALVRQACRPFDLAAFREGHLTPVFFGPASPKTSTATPSTSPAASSISTTPASERRESSSTDVKDVKATKAA